MKRTAIKIVLHCSIGLIWLCGGTQPALAKIKLPHVFTDHLVLQREAEAPVWGWADAGEKVTVTFAGQNKTVTANDHGKWLVKLDPLAASNEPHDLTVSGLDSSVKISDVLVGDVWLASGQSNMGFPLFAAHNATEVLPAAQDSLLRFFRVKTHTSAEPQTDCSGSWELTTPATAKNFSAVAYFFAQEIRRDQNVPVAVLQAPWGGTSIETWISLAGLKQSPPLTNVLARWDKAMADYKRINADPANPVAAYELDLKRWQKEVQPAFDAAMKKYNADKDAGKEVGPKPQPAQPEPNNPDPMGMPSPSRRPGTPTVNFNGMIAPLTPFALRGVIWYQGEANASHGLEYRELFPRLIEDWRNQWTQEGVSDFPFLYVQLPCNGKDTAPVAESGLPWLQEAQLLTLKVPRTGMAIAIDVGDPNNVHPTDKIDVGKRLALVARKKVYHEDIVASGPLFKDFKIEGGKIRISFTETGTGLIAGQQPWLARGVDPFPKDKLIGFFIAGEDRKWFAAEANIDGDAVVVFSASVPKPRAVRYGWANSPRCNLYNKEGLPASPFRTDEWLK